MWMTQYIKEIKRQFHKVYKFVPVEMVGDEPVFAHNQIPDGEYPMTIDGKLDRVKLTAGAISCCNFEKGE